MISGYERLCLMYFAYHKTRYVDQNMKHYNYNKLKHEKPLIITDQNIRGFNAYGSRFLSPYGWMNKILINCGSFWFEDQTGADLTRVQVSFAVWNFQRTGSLNISHHNRVIWGRRLTHTSCLCHLKTTRAYTQTCLYHPDISFRPLSFWMKKGKKTQSLLSELSYTLEPNQPYPQMLWPYEYMLGTWKLWKFFFF